MDLYWIRTGDMHDLEFVNGGCPTTKGRTDNVEQRLYIKLRTFKGEWYLNEEYGVPWMEEVLGIKVRKSTVDMIIQKAILEETGVERITHFSSTMSDSKTREYSCNFSVRTDEGLTTPIIIV